MCMCVSFCAACACSFHRGQRRRLDALDLELQGIVMCYIVVENQTCLFCRSGAPAQLPLDPSKLIVMH